MCTYKDIDTILVPNGKTASEANSDGSEDRVKLDRRTRTYRVLRRTAAPGRGRYAYLISR